MSRALARSRASVSKSASGARLYDHQTARPLDMLPRLRDLNHRPPEQDEPLPRGSAAELLEFHLKPELADPRLKPAFHLMLGELPLGLMPRLGQQGLQ